MIDRFEKKLKATQAKEAVLRESLKNDFFSLLKETMKNKSIRKIRWSQYTPYFNDGEECIFRVNPLECHVDINFYNLQKKYNEFINQPSSKKNYSLFYEIELNEANNEAIIEIKNYDSLNELHNIEGFSKQESDMTTLFTLSKLSELITSDYFEKVLLDTIGDHVEVIVLNENENVSVNIESYSHD